VSVQIFFNIVVEVLYYPFSAVYDVKLLIIIINI